MGSAKRQAQRYEGLIGAVAIFAIAVAVLVVASGSDERHGRPAASGSPPLTRPGPPDVDYVIDLNTGVMTPLPDSIIRTQGPQTAFATAPRYAVSPDGSLLAYVGNGDGGNLQIFMARIDGSGARQMTHDPKGARSPAWSPDGASIAYEGHAGSADVSNLFVLDVRTRASTQITDGARGLSGSAPQFTTDGSSLLYTGGSQERPVLRTVPVTGGKSTLLLGAGRGLHDAGNGSLSPDGSLMTFLASETTGPGPGRWVAKADGSERRELPSCVSDPAGTWSPDGGRIVCSDERGIIVIDIATGDTSRVADGKGAIWLDRHRLLVEV
jgi:Tol biopolymer transport system component